MSSLLPVISGLIVGIAFIFILATASFYSTTLSGPNPDPDYYSPLIQISIVGLKETYQSGERIDFEVTQKAAGCVFPETIFVKNIQTGIMVWQFNSTRANSSLFGCISMEADPSESQMTMNTRDEQPLVINQTGSYVVMAEHQHVKVEKHFRVLD